MAGKYPQRSRLRLGAVCQADETACQERSSTVPSPSEVLEQGYRRCIVSREYEVIEGSETIPSGHIVVKEWTLMDGNPVNKKREGKTYELHLLPEAVRPELNSEYTSDDLLLFDLPIYFNMEEND